MLSLLCSAPQLDAHDGPGSPLASGSGSSATAFPSTFTPQRKASRRMPSLSSALSSVTGTLKRRDPPCTGAASAPATTTSFRSKHGRTVSEAASIASKRLSRKLVTNVRERVPIGAPMAFKHHFHLGPANSRTNTGAWDENRWRQMIEMRMNEDEHTSVMVLDPPPPVPSSQPGTPRASISSTERKAHRDAAYEMLSRGRPAGPPAAAAAVGQSLVSRSTPALNNMGTGVEESEAAKAARAAKRASLVKRKPVPPLYPEEAPATPPVPQPQQRLSSCPSREVLPETEVPPLPATPAPAVAVVAEPAPVSSPAPTAHPPTPRDREPIHVVIPPVQIPGIRSSMTPPAVPPRRHTLGHTTMSRRRPAPSAGAGAGAGAGAVPPLPVVTSEATVAGIEEERQETTQMADEPRASLSSTRSSSEDSQDSHVSSGSGSESEASETSAESAEPRTPTTEKALALALEPVVVTPSDVETETEVDESVYETADDGGDDAARVPRLRARRKRSSLRAAAAAAEGAVAVVEA